MLNVGIIGASGYTGAELLRLAAGHGELNVVVATAASQAGTSVAATYPNLAAAYPDLEFAAYDDAIVDGLDLVFSALPHGESQRLVPAWRGRVKWVVDLAADFRLHDAGLYPTWYGEAHEAEHLLAEAVYGLPELYRGEIAGAWLVAGPGCYVTAASLALAPLLGAGLVDPIPGVIVDAASGVSGAGKPPKPHTTFGTVAEDFTAYGLLDHRHTPEIEQNLAKAAGHAVPVLFTPHLAPMTRGILATCYARPARATTTEEVLDALRCAYENERFVVVSDKSPSTKATRGSNTVHLTARHDERTGWIVVLSALDNLVKGASGQALQCANILAGFDEATGLSTTGLAP